MLNLMFYYCKNVNIGIEDLDQINFKLEYIKNNRKIYLNILFIYEVTYLVHININLELIYNK